MLDKVVKSCLGEIVPMVFKVGNEVICRDANRGENLLHFAHRSGIELEGACEGSLACSTCHVILDKSLYKTLGDPSEKEYDLLDQAFMPTSTSRLGCQLMIDNNFSGKPIMIPTVTRNIAVDGYKPKHH